ncbi:hypothetical protein D3C78_1331520 [compost metagenome]
MASVSAIGEASGTAAALYVFQGLQNVRKVQTSHIRFLLQLRGQFIEGEVERIPMPASSAWAEEIN